MTSISKLSIPRDDFLSVLLASTRVGIAVTDPRLEDNPVVFSNAAFSWITGYSPQDVLGKNLRLLHGPETDETARASISQAVKDARPVTAEILNYRKDGTTYWSRSVIDPVFDGRGNLVAFVGAIFDITAEREAHLALEEAQDRLKRLADVATDWLWETDENGVLQSASPRFYDVTGLNPQMLRGKTILKVVEKSERRPDAWEELVDAVAHRRPFRGVECKLQSPHGELYLRATGAPKTSRDGRFAGYFGASSDITQYVIDSKILREAGTAKAVGTLAAGMAHDFNNLLVPIVGFSEGLIDDLAGNEAACARLRAIHEAALHGRELIARLMRYSRGAGGTSLDCEAGDVVRKIIDIVRPICPSAIKLETSLPAEAMRLRCDALELEQCVINLVNNAVDAIGVKRGNVLIELSSAAGSGSQRWARLCVRDDGAGMTEEVRRRCLQPFFTTKDAGKGTGLGLAMVGALVRRRGGRIEIDSAPGAGTSITLVLPIADPPRGGA